MSCIKEGKGVNAHCFSVANSSAIPWFQSSFNTAPEDISISGICTKGKPTLIPFLKNIRANDRATTAEIPADFKAKGACSLDDPQPKLSPATRISPGLTFLLNVSFYISLLNFSMN